MTLRTVALLLTLLINVSVFSKTNSESSSYYSGQDKREFENGNTIDQALKRIIKHAAGRDFRPLGYRKNTKKILFGEIHLKEDQDGYFVYDLYCGFKIRSKVGPNRIPTNNIMNTEHTWPQSKGSKREPARGDLHHLFPTYNPANSARGNHPFGEIHNDDLRDAADNCSASQRGDLIDPSTGNRTRTHGFQPPISHRGNVARAMFYVAAKYDYRISSIEEFYLRKWHKEDPVDQDEIWRNGQVQDAQGNRNPFIDYPNLEERITDF